MRRLFVSDLDGTLAGRDARLSAFSRQHLARLLEAGLAFSIASARSVHTLAPIIDGLSLRLPVVELNGAFITDLKTKSPLVCHALAAPVAARAIEWALTSDIPPFLTTFARGRQNLYPPLALSNAGIAWYDASRRAARDVRLRGACDPRRVLDEQIVCVTLIAERAHLVPIARELAEVFPGQQSTLLYENAYQAGWFWLTVQSPLASKAHALRALADGAGIDRNETTVFGDEINDVPMFEVAGHAVAVENAVPELKRVAHQIIGPHHQDSVVRYLLGSASF